MRIAFVGLLCLGGCSLGNDDASSNHPPELEPVRVVTEEDQSETFRIVVRDRDGDLLDLRSDSGPVTIRDIEQSIDAEGTRLEATAVYRPRTNFNGVEFGWLSVSDGVETTRFDFELEVLPANDYPVARADAFAMTPDSPLAVPVAVVLRNDDDDADRYLPAAVEDDVLRIGRLREMSHGTVELAADTLTFTPEPGYIGTAGFEYVVTDEEDLHPKLLPVVSLAHVRIDIGGPNAAPITAPDRLQAMEGEIPRFWQAELVNNDRDDDGHTLWVIDVSNPTKGAVELVDGQIQFTPEPLGSFGEGYGFDYTVTDGMTTTVGHADLTIAPWL